MSPIRILSWSAVTVSILLGIAWIIYHRENQVDLPLVFSNDEKAPQYGCANDFLKKLPAAQNPGLIDITDEAGLVFQHVVGPLGTYYMPESIGAGGAIFDADSDGRLDIYLLNCGESPWTGRELPTGTRIENRLLRQTANGKFEDVTESSGLGDTGYAAGCAVGDVNNDGLPDVFVTNYGQDRLFLNRGSCQFVDVTAMSGIEEQDWGTCTSLFDYDRDGWLDLMVVNYTKDPEFQHSVACGFGHGLVSYCGPHKFQPTIDRLYHNEGPTLGTANSGERNDGSSAEDHRKEPLLVSFRDVTKEAGLDQATTYGFGVICADLTGDLWPDIFVANDSRANRLWVNQHDGTFQEEAILRGLAYNKHGVAEAGMGVAMGDLNDDGRQDLLVSHLSTESSTLYLNQDSGSFSDQTEEFGLVDLTKPHTGWGAALIDLNNDGNLDLPLVNGLVVPCHSGFPFHGEDQFQERNDDIRNSEVYWREYADRNTLLLGLPEGGFEEQLDAGGDFVRALASGRGLIYGDIDNDGDVDLLVTNCGGRARLYRNDLPAEGNWLRIRAVDGESGRNALGAIVEVRTSERKMTQILSPQSSYLASNEPCLHFGLHKSERAEAIIIFWPDGPTESAGEYFSLDGESRNRFEILRRGAGESYVIE